MSFPLTTSSRQNLAPGRLVAGPLVVALLLVSGCSSDSDDASSTPTSSTASATESSSATASESSTASSDASVSSSNSKDATPAIVAATNAFLDTLSDDEREAVSFEFSDTDQRQRWSNLPEGLFERQGLMWGDLGEGTQNAWLDVMKATLSDEGYDRVLAEWYADDELAGEGGNTYGREYYWIALIGTPSETEAWQWQFGGHHVTVNATLKGSDVSVTPSFIGVQPGTYDSDGNEVRPLGDIEDDAFDLVNSLDDDQQGEAVLGDTYIDLVLGPGEDGKTIESEGLVGSAMTEKQRDALLTLMGHYGGLVNDEDAAARMEELEADLDDTYFAWYGPTDDEGEGVYFRVTGPKIVIEYSGQEMGGDPSQHIHGIYRDPTNEYGAAFGAGLS